MAMIGSRHRDRDDMTATLSGAGVVLFVQGPDLRYRRIDGVIAGFSASGAIGKSDADLLPPEAADEMTRQKQAVMETGMPRRFQIGVTQGGDRHWLRVTAQASRDASGTICGIMGTIVDVSEEREAESRLRLAMREIAHRSKNLLAVVQAMARQTASHSPDLQTFGDRFSLRIAAFANSHDLLVHGGWQGASLRELAASQLGHFVDRIGSDVDLAGTDVRVSAEAAQNIGMALHELATNAAKHGALSVAGGKVSISWDRIETGDYRGGLTIHWKESGGPPVEAPKKRGFGHIVIERLAARSVGGSVTLDFHPEGVVWSLAVPAAHLANDGNSGSDAGRHLG